MTTCNDVIENLKKLVGAELAIEDFDDEIIIAFKDFEFEGETDVIVGEFYDGKCDAYIRSANAPIATILVEHLCKDGERGVMILGIEE